MIYHGSWTAICIFSIFVLTVLGISFYLGSKAKSAKGYFAAGGGIHWFVNGIAFAGDYLSAASFLGICGMIAFYGYDGFLYSIGYLAGWVVALFVIAEPLKRLGRFTFADALDNKFQSRGVKAAAGISALVVSLFYLIPQMVGAGALIKPLLGFEHYQGVLIVGVVVTLIVATAGMVSTTWVQFIKGGMLVVFCGILTMMILNRGLKVPTPENSPGAYIFKVLPAETVLARGDWGLMGEDGPWAGKPYARFKNKTDGRVEVWRKSADGKTLYEAQVLAVTADGTRMVNGIKQGEIRADGSVNDFYPVGQLTKLPGGKTETGPLGPFEFFAVLGDSQAALWIKDGKTLVSGEGAEKQTITVFYPKLTNGTEFMTPGSLPSFAGIRGDDWIPKINFLSLMLGLFCGTASLPHILIRYYTVKDQASARKSTVAGIAAIGFFYVLTLFLGLGAMSGGTLDPTDSNMSAPLLARGFGEFPFALISAIAFTTVLGTVSGLVMAASGAIVHDLMSGVFKVEMNDSKKVKLAKITAIFVGAAAMALGIIFKEMNVSFLVGWAFNVAASANLPALVMVLFWKGATKQGVAAAIITGMVTSLGWILLSEDAFKNVYHLDPAKALVPFSQPAILTIPLGFITLIAVSLLTKNQNNAKNHG